LTDRTPSPQQPGADIADLTGPSDAFDLDDLRRRAAGGAATLGARSALVLVLAVAGNIVLARLLVPRDFGLVALGTTILLAGSYIAAGGLGMALVGRSQAPRRRELEALTGLQLAVSCAVTAGVAAAAPAFGTEGAVIAIMVAALPLITLRAPYQIVLERGLAFRTIATVDVVEVVVQYVWAIGTVAAGAGVWGFASAAIARSVASTATMIHLAPLGFVRPRWAWRDMRPLLGFGLRYQGVSIVDVARDQVLNVGIAAFSGVSTLGIWSLAYRVLQVPLAVLVNLYRVSYPAMARLIGAGSDPRPALERVAGLTAMGLAVAGVAIVAGAPALVPALLGDRWDDVSAVLAAVVAGLLFSGPIAAAALGWLYSSGDAGTVLRASVLHAATLLTTGLVLLPVLGIVSAGIGWLAASLVNGIILERATRRGTGARLVRALLIPTGLGLLAGVLGWTVSTLGSGGVPLGVGAVVLAEAALLGGLLVLAPDLLRSGRALLAQGISEARPRRRRA
jgi:O-antigen/teichoic acid export membrane protein